MRAIMLACSATVVGGLGQRSLGEVTAVWLNTTWISTGARQAPPPPHTRPLLSARHRKPMHASPFWTGRSHSRCAAALIALWPKIW